MSDDLGHLFKRAPSAKRDDFKPGVALARQFYAAHELDFARAVGQDKAAGRRFDFTAAQFDDWAVAAGHMPLAVRSAMGVARDGLAQLRNQLRGRLNRAARQGDGVARAFSVEARGGRWRVVLVERFLEEQPHEIVDALWKTYEHAGTKIEGLKKQARGVDHLEDNERTLILTRLEGAEGHIFWGIQQIQMIAHQIHPSAQLPDLRKLRRDVAKVMNDAFYGKPPVRRKAKAVQKQSPAA